MPTRLNDRLRQLNNSIESLRARIVSLELRVKELDDSHWACPLRSDSQTHAIAQVPPGEETADDGNKPH